MVSQGLQATWSCELQRFREEAALEVHAMYADDKAHLDFCMSEMQRLEKEVDRLNERSQIQAATALREATKVRCSTNGTQSVLSGALKKCSA
jgi:hypothetical protein